MEGLNGKFTTIVNKFGTSFLNVGHQHKLYSEFFFHLFSFFFSLLLSKEADSWKLDTDLNNGVATAIRLFFENILIYL